MTSLVSTRAAAATPATRVTPRFIGVRGWLADWAHAFRATAREPHPAGMDPVALRLFGRD